MIQYYAYYSCGGYKDLYLGNSLETLEESFFLPLLSIWKSRTKAEYADKLKQAENLLKIEIISKENSFDFPAQAKKLFSHGGYRVIYLTLSNGNTCLCVRDITNGAKDEEDRDIPFSILLTASDEDDIQQLDAYAIYSLSHIPELYDSLASLFSYDPIINGVKFSISQITKLINNIPLPINKIEHKPNHVIFLIVDTFSMIQTAYRELDLSEERIDLIADCNGKRNGTIRYKMIEKHEFNEISKVDTKSDREHNPENNFEVPILEETESGKLEKKSLLKKNVSEYIEVEPPNEIENLVTQNNDNMSQFSLVEIQKTLSLHSLSLKDIMECTSDNKTELKKHSECISRLATIVQNNLESNQNTSEVDDEKVSNFITIPKVNLWIALIALLIGFLLGSLIF